jgi:hypothetical protein
MTARFLVVALCFFALGCIGSALGAEAVGALRMVAANGESGAAKRDLKGELLRLEEAVSGLAKEPEFWMKQLTPGAAKFGLVAALGRADARVAELEKKHPVALGIVALKEGLSTNRSVDSQIPVEDQADFLRQIGVMEERVEALGRRYSAVVHAMRLQRQTFATWLKFWEIAAAIEGESEANYRMGALVARENLEREASRKRVATIISDKQQTPQLRNGEGDGGESRKAEKSAKPLNGSDVVVSVAGASGAGEKDVQMDRSFDSSAQPPSPGRSIPGERLIALEEAVSLRGVEKGGPVYLSGQFVVTASGRNRAVLRSVQAGAASLITRIIVEYEAGSALPAPGVTFPDDGHGRFEIREVRRWSPLQRPPAGEVQVFVKARSVSNESP